ncbi:MAG: hypothetical protein WED34_07550 [Planctomycetales bacterium]
MATVETIIAVIAVVFLVVIVLVVIVASLRGKDLVIFDAYKTSAPKLYRNLKSVCRVNGAMVALICICGMIAAPFVAFHPDGGVLLAIGMLVGSGVFLWLSVRWFLWSLRA